MSALVSTIALAWSGVSSYGNASSICFWNGPSGCERVSGRREPAPVEDDELAGDVAHCLPHAGPRLLPVAAAHLRQLRLLAAGVLADEADVLGVDVHTVAALELDDETVARDAEHLARLHAEVLADTVHAVHDEVVCREAFVVIGGFACASRLAMHAPAPGEIGFGDERELHGRQHDAAVERGDDDVDRRALRDEHLLDARLGTASPRR